MSWLVSKPCAFDAHLAMAKRKDINNTHGNHKKRPIKSTKKKQQKLLLQIGCCLQCTIIHLIIFDFFFEKKNNKKTKLVFPSIGGMSSFWFYDNIACRISIQNCIQFWFSLSSLLLQPFNVFVCLYNANVHNEKSFASISCHISNRCQRSSALLCIRSLALSHSLRFGYVGLQCRLTYEMQVNHCIEPVYAA